MTYAQFTAKYESLLREMFKYNIDQVGSQVFAAKLADLTDAHPVYEARYDASH